MSVRMSHKPETSDVAITEEAQMKLATSNSETPKRQSEHCRVEAFLILRKQLGHTRVWQ